jgi:hypothetical protein
LATKVGKIETLFTKQPFALRLLASTGTFLHFELWQSWQRTIPEAPSEVAERVSLGLIAKLCCGALKPEEK